MQASGRTRIQLCGRLVVELDGRRLEDSLPARQGRLLFAYLVLAGDRTVRRDELADCIWSERPPADPAASLNTLISRLRHTLGSGVIKGKAELSLTLPLNAEIDVKLAADALARARSAAADQDWQAAWGPAHAALAIAQRGLLPGLEAPWIEQQRRQLEELELEALELVAETGLGLGGAELAAAERASTALVERAPFRESGHRLRMQVLAARGNVAEALKAYEELRRLLGEELGASPSAALIALHARLLRGEAAEVEHAGEVVAVPSAVDGVEFVGRRRELQALEGALAEIRGGRRRMVLISGEAGMGKTRLALELTQRASVSGSEVFWGRCYEGPGAPAFWPWMEAVRSMTQRRRPEQVRRALGPGAADLAQILPELGELFPSLEPTQILDPEAARFRLYDSLSRFLSRLAATRPLVLVLDDLHWADPPSLEVLRFLAFRPDPASILVIGTYRDTEVSAPLADALAELARQPLVSRLELAGFDERELASLVSGATGTEVGEAVIAALHDRTEGNPFFVSELVRLLEGEGELESARADTVLRRELPGGLRDVIRRRLARLPEESVGLLTQAAVVGEEFELRLLACVSGLDGERALELIEAALRERIASESHLAVGSYRFSHALIRETLYAELSAMRRARLHCTVGEALEQLQGQDPDRVIELAHHFYEGAATSAEAAEKAYSYAVRAAEQATARLAYEQSEQQLRRALELLERMPVGPQRIQRELEVQVRLGTLLMMTHGYAAPEVGEACARARELCREVENEPLLLSSLWRLGVFHEVRAEFPKSRQIGEQLLALGRRNGRTDFRLGGHQLVGVAAVQCGELDLAREQLEEAMALAGSFADGALADIFGHDFRVTSRAFLGWALTLLGEDGRAEELLAEALALARERSHPFDQAFALFLNALCSVFRRDVESASLQAEEALELSSDRGFPLFAAMTGIIRGWAEGQGAEPAAGVAAIEEGLAALQVTGAQMMLHSYRALLAEAYWSAGRLDEALAAVEQGLAEVETNGRFYEAELHRLKGELLLALRPTEVAEAARASLREAVTVARKQNARTFARRAEARLRDLANH